MKTMKAMAGNVPFYPTYKELKLTNVHWQKGIAHTFYPTYKELKQSVLKLVNIVRGFFILPIKN